MVRAKRVNTGSKRVSRKLKRTSILNERRATAGGEVGVGGKADRGKERERFQANWKNTVEKVTRTGDRKHTGVLKLADCETRRVEK